MFNGLGGVYFALLFAVVPSAAFIVCPLFVSTVRISQLHSCFRTHGFNFYDNLQPKSVARFNSFKSYFV